MNIKEIYEREKMYLLDISKLLGYSDEELERYCNMKMDKTLNMINKS